MKARINQWETNKLKSFYIAKKTINKMKRWPTEWGKIVVNMTSKRLIFNIYKWLIQLDVKQQQEKKTLINKWAEESNNIFQIIYAYDTWKGAQHS